MPNDIKYHIENKSIKTVDKTVKGSPNKIKNSINNAVNDKSENTDLDKILSTVTASSSAEGYVGSRPIKMAASIPEKIQDREIRNEKKLYREYSKDIKSKNNVHKENIKNAKTEYQEVKNRYKDKLNAKNEIKSAKNKYYSIKRTEKAEIKSNNKILKLNWKKVRRAESIKNRLRLTASIIAAVFMFAIIASVVSLMASPIGIMLAESGDDNAYSVSNIITEINQEFSNELKNIELNNPCDRASISNYGCTYSLANWQDVFAVWDIKACLKTEEIVAFIDKKQFEDIRSIVWDMTSISYYTENNIISEEMYDADGNLYTVETTTSVLYINVEYKSVDEMAVKYSFNEEEKLELTNLMASPEFLGLFEDIVGSVIGSGSPIYGTGDFIYPTASTKISAGYPNYSNGSYHGGVDFPVSIGTNVFAVCDGVVSTVRKLDYSYGYYVIIDHGNGLSTLYAHNSELLVTEGQAVKQGDVIALSGSTGNSTGPHCHFEVRVNGNRVNPMNYLR